MNIIYNYFYNNSFCVKAASLFSVEMYFHNCLLYNILWRQPPDYGLKRLGLLCLEKQSISSMITLNSELWWMQWEVTGDVFLSSYADSYILKKKSYGELWSNVSWVIRHCEKAGDKRLTANNFDLSIWACRIQSASSTLLQQKYFKIFCIVFKITTNRRAYFCL